jgi:GDPmannose 4,6-dehydratase
MEHQGKKVALITGITGQDGSYLAELLLAKDYQVHGLVRRGSTFNRERIEHLYSEDKDAKKIELHYGDLTDSSNISRLLEKIRPNEIYNLGAQSHVRISFDVPEYTSNTNALGAMRLLEAIRDTRGDTKFYQASTSEMFGKVKEVPQSENTPFYPRSPYAISKLFAHWSVVNFRESYGLFACSGILFNHESPRRGENFLTRKVTLGVAEILAGRRKKIFLGNLSAKRDWGYAPEYVDAMWRMLQQDKPDDFVIATGETHTVEEFVVETFKQAGITDWQNYVELIPKYERPAEVDLLVGDYSKAKNIMGWEPQVRFKQLVRIMLEADCLRLGINLPDIV